MEVGQFSSFRVPLKVFVIAVVRLGELLSCTKDVRTSDLGMSFRSLSQARRAQAILVRVSEYAYLSYLVRAFGGFL